MAGELLLDTGALVSLLDSGQRLHRQCTELFERWRAPVVSTEAILTEATHLLGRVHGGRQACLDFFLRGGAALVPTTLTALRRCRELVAKYDDLPMDYADATLVVLAEELGANTILTTDRDFSVYRYGRDRSFKVLPG